VKNPFQVGDLVRSRINSTNLALVTNTHKISTGYYVDVLWLASGKEIEFYAVRRFKLVSRGIEQ